MSMATSITVQVPLAIRHRPGRKTVVMPVEEGATAVAMRASRHSAPSSAFAVARLRRHGLATRP
ncbi:hypothetical protein E2C06_29640 [Dankookia rubra]|uniref:Uncharacterized protein n=1 Tax=Dankookia rubra TaxID=1442381 RepID=A0A4R5Q900_9PROT|nr:hypothetical protein E2C06_29640 [Dankookia rubra]